MKIAIQAADLDAPRIDGTRVYIKNLLAYFGRLDAKNEFLIYHKKEFNPELAPANFPNYRIIKKNLPFFWTQLRLSSSLFLDKPDSLWMPMHNIPFFRPRGLKTIVTVHDLAFKFFPDCFKKKELLKLNFLAGLAIRKSDKIIAISESTKRDILKFYPKISEDKIKVIYHGFESALFEAPRDIQKEAEVKDRFQIKGAYLLYVGAIQPRKNLGVLIDAFQEIKKKETFRNLKLVLAGEKAWLWQDIFEKIGACPNKADIITPGKIKFGELGHLMRGAEIFCFPSLYEGFGIPVLEAFAAGVPVICTDNSSLPEVAGEAALYFDGHDHSGLADKIERLLADRQLKEEMIKKGKIQKSKFSWEKCAQETLDYLKS